MSRDPTVNPYILRALQNRIDMDTQEKAQPRIQKTPSGLERLKELGIQRLREMGLPVPGEEPWTRSPTHPVPTKADDWIDPDEIDPDEEYEEGARVKV
jgi:hypothetical protein